MLLQLTVRKKSKIQEPEVKKPVRPVRVPLGRVVPLPKLVPDTHPLENVVVKTKNKPSKLGEVDVWIGLLLSKNPHLQFMCIHQSSLSNYIKQVLFRNTRTGVVEVKTLDELRENYWTNRPMQIVESVSTFKLEKIFVSKE